MGIKYLRSNASRYYPKLIDIRSDMSAIETTLSSKSQFVKENQSTVFTTESWLTSNTGYKGPSNIIFLKPFKRESQRSNLYKKRETKNTYEPHQQMTTTEHQMPDLGRVQTNAADLNV